MKKLLTTIIWCLLAIVPPANAQDTVRTDSLSETNKQAHADSLKKVMYQPDYIVASLLVASPGFEVYSDSGHAALRMRCPSKGVDHTFEFASLVSFSSTLEFMQGNMAGGFERLLTEDYIQRYKDEGRGVDEIQLNLTPEQKLKLWAFVDKQCETPGLFHFDYLVYDCSNMVVWAIESNLLGEEIKYHDVDPRILGTYRETSAVVQPFSPWAALFWDIMMGTYCDEQTDFKGHLYPNFLYAEWQRATIADSLGNERALMIGKPITLAAPTIENKPVAITPLMVLWTLFVLAVLASLAQWKWGYNIFTRCVDIVFFTIQTLLGLWIADLIFISNQVATDWNWLIVVFNPLPIVLWTVFRKRPATRYLYMLFTIVAIIYAASKPWNPQLIFSHLYILVLAMALRTACLARK